MPTHDPKHILKNVDKNNQVVFVLQQLWTVIKKRKKGKNSQFSYNLPETGL